MLRSVAHDESSTRTVGLAHNASSTDGSATSRDCSGVCVREGAMGESEYEDYLRMTGGDVPQEPQR